MVGSTRLPNFNHLYYFHAVASEGSLAKAAQRLRITEPTISAQIRQLEGFIGHRLFHRSAQGMRLTAKGEYVFEHTSLMFRASQRMLQGLKPKAAPEPRSLAIGVAASVANTLAARTFVPLLSDGVLVQIRHGDEDFLLRDLLSRDIDILLGDHAPVGSRERRLVAEEIARPALVVVAPRSLATRVKTFPRDLGKIPFILYPPRCRYRWEIERTFDEHGIEARILGETEDLGIMLACVQAGVGAAIIPQIQVESVLGNKRVVVLGTLSIEAPVFACYQRTDTSDLVKRAIETLRGGSPASARAKRAVN